MTDEEDVEQLVKRLKKLQIEQAVIVDRLEAIERKRVSLAARGLCPGDRVEIITRGKVVSSGDASKLHTVGTITSITPKRVKVKTDGGAITYRHITT